MVGMADGIGAAARGGALALGVIALATLRPLPSAPSAALPQRAAVVAADDHPDVPPEAEPRAATGDLPADGTGDRWALRSGGWYISVDGAVVPILSVSEQTAARPRSGLALTLSPFDNIIWYHANAEGLDWRLVAALIFEESRFNPTARSSKGAYGLMQVMPVAADAVGAAHFEAPDDNVRAGVRYLRQLDEMFQQVGGLDRLKFVLAAYNMGPGHVRDAQALARRFGYDPYRWDDAVAVMLPLLEEPAIYETLPLGFARGNSTVAYVSRVLERFKQYRHATPATTDAGQAVTRG
jgi:soluble lytic murein transglycosylase-like protein